MEIKKFTEPFSYYIIDDIISFEENEMIYKELQLDEAPKSEPSMHSMGVELSIFDSIWDRVHKICAEILSEDIKLPKGYWGGGLQKHFNEPLHPHTDYFPNNNTASVYKGLVYIGDSKINYKDYGTKIYKKISEYSEAIPFPIVDMDMIDIDSEVEFKPGRAILFIPSENSLHGACFDSGFPYDRYTYGFEYYPSTFLQI